VEMVNFTLRLLYSRRKIPRYSLDRMGEPQNHYGRRGGEKDLAPIGIPTLRPSSPQPIVIIIIVIIILLLLLLLVVVVVVV
jgi:hypothetical protein